MATIQKINPCLWFDTQAEEAARYYVSTFKNSKVGRISRYPKEGFEIHQMPEGTVLTVAFELEGQRFTAMNGGPAFKFNEAISLQIICDKQEEIDFYWNKLTQGGEPQAQQCGWLKDKYGVSWQVVPRMILEAFEDHTSEKANRTMRAMLPMKKLDIKALQEASQGVPA